MKRADIENGSQHVLDATLRADFYAFVQKVFAELRPGDRFSPNWHLDAVCHAVMETVDGTNPRLLVTLPPRSLKSIIISVALPAFVLGRDPTRRVVCISYNEDLAMTFAADFRKIIAAPWYRRLFPGTVIRKNTDREIRTTRGGSRYATSINGTLTGRGGNLFIIDDPIKPADALSKPKREATNEWLRSTLASRADDKQRDKMIMLMQRVHADDPAGAVLASGGWQHLNLPAIADRDEEIPLSFGRKHFRSAETALDEKREPLHVLESLRRHMGDIAFTAQYLQAPELPQGGIIKRAWLRTAEQEDYPYDDPSAQMIQSWDTAMVSNESADWSVCTTWLVARDCFYLVDIFRDRLVYPDLRAAIIARKNDYDPEHIIIEDKGAGTSLIQDFFHDPLIVPYRCNDAKEVRAGRASVALNQGRVFLPTGRPPWVELFVEELLAFPAGRHDDQVDSMVQAIDWWENHRQTTTTIFGTY